MRKWIVPWTCALALTLTATLAHAFTDEEHRHLALHAFRNVATVGATVTPEALAEITVRSSRDDMSPSRFQVRGKTPREQAAVVTPERLGEIVADVIENPPTDNAFGPYFDNVVANYVVYHALALRCALRDSMWWEWDEPPPRIRTEQTQLTEKPHHSEWVDRALVFEAVAQGYLADAFSSSHMLTPSHLPFASIQHANRRAAHEFFATQGAYAYAQGEVWQAFGDGLLRWYGPAYDHVVETCDWSAAEIVRIIEQFQKEKIDEARFVDWIPVPVVAAWRYQPEPQLHPMFYPRFRKESLDDPDLRADSRFLFPRSAFHPWLGGLFSEDQNPTEIARNEPAVASVEFHQTLDVPPAFAGLLLMAGGGALVAEDGGGGVGSVAAGYAWGFAVPLLARLRTSLELEYLYRLGDSDRRVITPRYALGLGAPVVPGIEAVHFEVGYGWGLHAPYKDQGVKWAVGIGTKPLRIPFTYAGVSGRIKYERFWMDEALDGFQLQLILR